MRRLRPALPGLLCLLLAAPVVGQATSPVHLTGRVVEEETGAPIAGALVEVVDLDESRIARQVTGHEGEFLFVLPDGGGYKFRADRLGYRRTLTPTLWTDSRDSFQVEIRLHPEAILLAPLEVTAWSPRVGENPTLRGFRDRLASGLGYFFTREDVERRKPVLVSDVIATVPGVRLESSGRGSRRRIYMARSVDGCPAQIFVDGFLLNPEAHQAVGADLALDDAVSPSAVEGIEVYRGLSAVPAEFLNPQSRCGVIVVWTRREG